jgi:hypothetical protein
MSRRFIDYIFCNFYVSFLRFIITSPYKLPKRENHIHLLFLYSFINNLATFCH